MKAVILDMGNVLVTYDHPKTLAAVATGVGCDVETVGSALTTMDKALTVGAASAHDLYLTLVDQYDGQFTYQTFLAWFGGGIRRDDEALAYAVALQDRPETTVAIISNTNDGHVHWLDEHLPELKQLDLVIMSNEVGIGKPDAAVFQLALELLNLPPEQAIFIDDRAENVEAARELGLAGIVHSAWTETGPKLEAWLAE